MEEFRGSYGSSVYIFGASQDSMPIEILINDAIVLGYAV